MQWVLAISVLLVAYVYAGYPALIGLWARWRPRPVRKGPFAGGVAVLIAAHNEADALPRKLDNLLELAQAEPIREIWIGLDGCTDGTGERLRERIQRSEVGGQTGDLQPATCNLQPATPISNIQCSISNVQGGGGEGETRSDVRGPRSDGQPATWNLEPGTCNLQPATLNLQPANPISNIQCSISNVQGEAGGVGERSEVSGQMPDGQSVSCPLTPVPCPLSPVPCPLSPVIHLLEFPQRRGKAAVLNDLMTRATQPIFAMMDARQRVEAGAISKLLENFADDRVGAVSGELVYETAAGAAQKGAESYWGYEKFIRLAESRVWAVPGATGALYAIRKDLCAPIPENTLVDDVLIPMRAVLKGYRCLFEPAARVFDLPSARFGQEGLRKRRTLAGIWQLAGLEPRIFSFRANPIAFQWYSHKFLRLLTPFFVLAGLGAAGMMENWKDGEWGWAGIVFWLMIGCAVASFLAFLGEKRVKSRILGLLGSFFGVNWALLQAAGDAWTGRFDAKWVKSVGHGQPKA